MQIAYMSHLCKIGLILTNKDAVSRGRMVRYQNELADRESLLRLHKDQMFVIALAPAAVLSPLNSTTKADYTYR